MSINFDAVLFDFDGTIADTGEGIFKSVLYSLEQLGEPPISDERLRAFVGPPLKFSFKEQCGLSEERAEEAVAKYRERYSVCGLFELKFYDGMTELVKKLREAGVKTAVASAKPEVFIKRILSHFELDTVFDASRGTDLGESRADKAVILQRALSDIGGASRVLMVGDKSYDIKAARDIGAVAAGVLFGYGSRGELTQAGADILVGSASELEKVIFGDD